VPGNEIVGRDKELQELSSFLEQSAYPGALLIEGDPGIGKTTLWRAGVDAARELSYIVLRASPAEKEATFSYSVVSDLLGDVLDGALPGLPGPQRRALEIALLLRDSDGPPPEQHTLGVALLGVLRTLASSRPVVLAVDDVQWLDRSSAAMLEFAVRRLRGEQVALLLARRQSSRLGSERLDLALPEERRFTVRVGPLSMGALHRLLGDRLGTTLARPALRRVHEASGGNPFYALELVRALESSGGWIRPGHPLPVPETLEAILRERIDALPESVRQVLTAAAALRRPTESVLGDWPALGQASEAGLIEITNDEVRFMHPLLASTAYGSISAAERRRLHRRLAEVVSDPEERARHLALGAEGPDGDVADALEGAAREAAARGAPAAAAELAELALRLTPTSESGWLPERRVDAAWYHVAAGELDTAASMLEQLEEFSPGGARADALLLLASAQQSFKRCLELAESALVDARGDDARVAKLECYIGELLLMQGSSDLALEHARAALKAAERAGDPTILATALSTVAWFETGAAVEPTPGLVERAVVLEDAAIGAGVYDTSSPSFVLGMRLMFAGRLDEARTRMDMLLERAVSAGDEAAVIAALLHQAELEFRAGNWSLAAQKAAEGYERAEQIGRDQDMSALLYARALVDGHVGRVEEAREAAARGIELSERCGDEVFRLQHLSVLGFLELSIGDPEAADRILRPLAARLASLGWREPSIYGELPNAIEALVELAELEEARRLLAGLRDRLSRIESPWGEASAGRCEGLVLAAEGDLAAASSVLERALAVHERLPQPFDLARTMLALGTVRRRTRKRAASRKTLERALAIFDELGATLWAEKARSELARIGGRRAYPADELTPSEQRIADLVAEGKTNKEVAAILVVADRTVESALTQIYRKLDVRSRTELARKLLSA
jgi:DNA-binding CsgD family transcriptional regulator/DNA polymerase III delta prime subunit